VSDIAAKLLKETSLPQGFTITAVDDSLLIYLLQLNNDRTPSTVACIAMKSDLTVTCSLQGKVVSASQYEDPVKYRVSQLVNLMDRLKSWHTDPSSTASSFYILTATVELKKATDCMQDSSCEEYRKISFIIEQLKLLQKQKHGRHYTPQLTIFTFMLHAASPAAYKLLLDENVLCLPSTNTLKKVTRRVNSLTSVDNSAYLHLRVSFTAERARKNSDADHR